MMDVFKTILFPFNEAYVFEIFLQSEIMVQTHIHVVKKKSEFIIKSRNPEVIKKNIPIVLCVSGKGVITKIEQEKNSLQIFRKNINEEEFLVEDYDSENFHAFSAIRQTLIEEVIQYLNFKPEQIAAVYPGALQVNKYLSGFKIQNGQLSIANHDFEVGDQILNYRFKSEASAENKRISIFNEEIDEKNVIAYLSGIDFLMKGMSSVLLLTDKYHQNYSSLLFKRNTHKVLKFALPAFFTLLIINSIVSFYVNQKTDDQSLRKQNFKTIYEKNKALKFENERIRNSIQFDLFTRQYSMAFMIDQMMAVKPPSITMEELSFFPLSDQKSNSGIPDYNQNEIIMHGLSQNHFDIKNWVVMLKQKDWIKKASIETYKKQNRSTLNEFELSIEI